MRFYQHPLCKNPRPAFSKKRPSSCQTSAVFAKPAQFRRASSRLCPLSPGRSSQPLRARNTHAVRAGRRHSPLMLTASLFAGFFFLLTPPNSHKNSHNLPSTVDYCCPTAIVVARATKNYVPPFTLRQGTPKIGPETRPQPGGQDGTDDNCDTNSLGTGGPERGFVTQREECNLGGPTPGLNAGVGALERFIDALPDEEKHEAVALCWFGRGDDDTTKLRCGRLVVRSQKQQRGTSPARRPLIIVLSPGCNATAWSARLG